MNYSKMLLDSLLENQDVCPKCGVSWVALKHSLLTEPVDSPDLYQTLIIIKNCDVCEAYFKKGGKMK